MNPNLLRTQWHRLPEKIIRELQAEKLRRYLREVVVPFSAHYREMFNSRQLLGLEHSCRLISKVENQSIREALATNLSDLFGSGSSGPEPCAHAHVLERVKVTRSGREVAPADPPPTAQRVVVPSR